jgi:hypothetical protein
MNFSAGLVLYAAVRRMSILRSILDFALWPEAYRNKIHEKLKRLDPDFAESDLPC